MNKELIAVLKGYGTVYKPVFEDHGERNNSLQIWQIDIVLKDELNRRLIFLLEKTFQFYSFIDSNLYMLKTVFIYEIIIFMYNY
jgi:hypothetical protein